MGLKSTLGHQWEERGLLAGKKKRRGGKGLPPTASEWEGRIR